MESLFTRSPTPSLLSLVHNSLHSQLLATVLLFLHWVFVVSSAQEDILIALLNISHILRPIYLRRNNTLHTHTAMSMSVLLRTY